MPHYHFSDGSTLSPNLDAGQRCDRIRQAREARQAQLERDMTRVNWGITIALAFTGGFVLAIAYAAGAAGL